MRTIILAAALAALTVPALASIPVGRGEISATLTGTETYDSNVFGTPDATADWSSMLVPHVAYAHKSGQIEAEADAGVSIIRYLDQTQLDANNLDASTTLQVLESDFRNYSGLLSASYREASEINNDLNARINSRTAIYNGRTALVLGPKSDAAVSGTYTDSRYSGGNDQQFLTSEALYDYKDFFYDNSLRLVSSYDELHSSGSDAIGVPLDQNSYLLSAGLDRALYHDLLRGGLSYGYRVLNRSEAETRVNGGERQQSGNVIGVSLEGPFLPPTLFPRVTSLLSLVYQDAATPGIYDTGTKVLTGHLSLAWEARENTTVTFSADRIQRLAVNGIAVVTTSTSLEVQQKLHLRLTGTLGAGYEWSSYHPDGRADQTAKFDAGLRYEFARVWNARLIGTYRSTSSTLPAAIYNRLVMSLSLTREF